MTERQQVYSMKFLITLVRAVDARLSIFTLQFSSPTHFEEAESLGDEASTDYTTRSELIFSFLIIVKYGDLNNHTLIFATKIH